MHLPDESSASLPVHEMPGFEPADPEVIEQHQTLTGRISARMNSFLRHALEKEAGQRSSEE
jgi:hypothetical protein